jgi:hypothetical protein
MRRPLNIEVDEEGGHRLLVYEYANGERVRKKIDGTKRKASHRRSRPKVKIMDRTRKKRI